MLQLLHGGAAARPFVTHSNAVDVDLFPRIAPELYLKRCVVGGVDKVFEINRNFRNEGVDSSHSPEFAMLEFYQAYGDYNAMAVLQRELIQEAAFAIGGSHVVTRADGWRIRLRRRMAYGHGLRLALRGAGRGGQASARPSASRSPTPTRWSWASTRNGARASSRRSFSRNSWCRRCGRRRSCGTIRPRPAR